MLHAWERYGLEGAEKEYILKFNKSDRRKTHVSFSRVVRGKIEFVGFVRGRDNEVYLSLLERYLLLEKDAHAQPVVVTNLSDRSVDDRAIWLLEDENGLQGTAFAVQYGNGTFLVTAAHNVEGNGLKASRPQVRLGPEYPCSVVWKRDDYDVAVVTVQARIPVVFRIADQVVLNVGETIGLLGFPRYRYGSTVHHDSGPITARRTYHSVDHFVVQPPIVSGNSGGPILNDDHEVVGIAVRGVGTPGRFTEDDELSTFVSIRHLTEHYPVSAASSAGAT